MSDEWAKFDGQTVNFLLEDVVTLIRALGEIRDTAQDLGPDGCSDVARKALRRVRDNPTVPVKA